MDQEPGHTLDAGGLCRLSGPDNAVAGALVARGDTRQAHHVTSAACAVGQWTTLLELVLSLEPSALRVLADL